MPSGHEIRLLKLFCSECSLCARLWLKGLFSFVDKVFMSCMGLSGHYNIPAYLSWYLQHGTCRQELVLLFVSCSAARRYSCRICSRVHHLVLVSRHGIWGSRMIHVRVLP